MDIFFNVFEKLKNQIKNWKTKWDKKFLSRNLSLENIKSSNISSLDSSQFNYDFLDFGASKGGAIDFAIKSLNGTKGLGIDNDPNKVQKMLRNGYDCLLGDITQLDLPPNSVRFVTMSHIMEHLPDILTVKKAIKSASKVASDFLFIQGPYFDADKYLKSYGLKFYWSDWRGHPCHLTTGQLREILMDIALNNHIIKGRELIKDSSDPAIHPIDSPIDQHGYIAGIHSKKPFVRFKQPIYKEMVCYVQLRHLENWGEIINVRKGCTLMKAEK